MANNLENKRDAPGTKLIGFVVAASVVVGVVSATAGIAAILGDDFTGGGILMLAAAFSFGLLVNSLLRN